MKNIARFGKYKKNSISTVYLTLLVLVILFTGSYIVTCAIAQRWILFSHTSITGQAGPRGQAGSGQVKEWDTSISIATRKPLFIGLDVPSSATYRLVSDEARHEDWGIDITLSSGTKLNICTGCQPFIAECGGMMDEGCTTTKTIGNISFTEYRPKNNPQNVAGYSNNSRLDPSIKITPLNNLPLSKLEQQILGLIVKTCW